MAIVVCRQSADQAVANLTVGARYQNDRFAHWILE
jgi:hypothetical protein